MSVTKSAFDLASCARPNILKLQPYRCARDDYKDDGTNVLLDANENACGPGLLLDAERGIAVNDSNQPHVDFLGLNRYPDPHQFDLKERFCRLRNTRTHTQKTLKPENMFVGVGSDEAIDALLRCFCIPGKDKLLTCPPTYGMYGVSADVNDVEVVKVPLRPESRFSLQPDLINEQLTADPRIKLVYITSPGNPTAQSISKADVQSVLEHKSWNGVVVVDEAYVDFAPEGSSLAEWVLEWPNLVVMQTLSKAFGLAGIRVGVTFSSPEIAGLLNNMKAPYSISSPTSAIAKIAFDEQHLSVMRKNIEKLVEQRQRMLQELPKIPGVGRNVGGTDANFLLYEILDGPNGKPDNKTALEVYETMAGSRGVVVRFRGKELGCPGCLRITVGTETEVDRFLEALRSVLNAIYRRSNGTTTDGDMERAAREANAVIS